MMARVHLAAAGLTLMGVLSLQRSVLNTDHSYYSSGHVVHWWVHQIKLSTDQLDTAGVTGPQGSRFDKVVYTKNTPVKWYFEVGVNYPGRYIAHVIIFTKFIEKFKPGCACVHPFIYAMPTYPMGKDFFLPLSLSIPCLQIS